MPEKVSNKERLREITESIETGIKELFASEKYQQYLRTMSRFHRYSVNNTMLIYMQKPDATLVAGFNKWRDQFERNVNKGERGIKIIAPTPYKKKVEREKLDPSTMLPMLDENGKVIMEEKEIKIPMYKPVTVFDVSQTSGKPLPQLASTLTGDVQNYDVFMEAVKRSAPVPITFKPLEANTDGFFSVENQSITLREGMSEVQTVCAAVHEIAHSKLHNYDHDKTDKKDRRTEEVEAESVSYAVCAYFGIPTGENSFGYIAAWSKDKELSELRASLETINKTSSELITDIDQNYAAVMKERGETEKAEQTKSDLSEQRAEEPEKEIAVEESPEPQAEAPDPVISREAMNSYGYLDENMVPLTRERALEMFERDVPVYLLYTDNTEAMAFDADEIKAFDGMFGVAANDWEILNEQLSDYESNFRNSAKDGYMILQLNDNPEAAPLRFENMEYLEKNGLNAEFGNYRAVYSGDFDFTGKDKYDALNDLYMRFNIQHPEDFAGHSLSVSDIIVLRAQGQLSSHYVDSWGFKELPQFLPDNYLINAEIALEDDLGMIDGIINNGQKEVTAKDERPSVLERLKGQATAGSHELHEKTAPKLSAEREKKHEAYL